MPSCNLFSHPGTALLRHLGDVAQTSRDIACSKEIALETLGLSHTQFISFVETVAVAHDFGKSTRYFQEYLLHRPDEQYSRPLEANHGALSAIFAYYVLQHIFRDHTIGIAPYLPYIGFLIIKRHHGDLKDVKNEIEDAVDPDKLGVIDNQIASIDPVELQRLYATLLPNVPVDTFLRSYRDVLYRLNADKFAFDKWLRATSGPTACIFSLLCYSILISADKTEASGVSVERRVSTLTKNLVDRYRENEGFDQATTDINRVRNAIYDDVMRSIESINIAQTKIMSLTAPTGTGKTLTALSAALKLRQRICETRGYCPRIVYSLPFLSIIDQNFEVVEDVLARSGVPMTSDVALKHHHLADVFYATVDNEFALDAAQFLIEGWNSEIVVTTFVQFFHSLFTNKNRSLRKFHNIVNSIVILDEVQAIPHKYWHLLNDFLVVLGACFGTYIILITATQPLIFQRNVEELLPEKDKYFEHFNRTRLYPYVGAARSFAEFTTKIQDDIAQNPTKSFLIVLNTIRCARLMYACLAQADDESSTHCYLSTHVTPKERSERIQEIKQSTKRKVIVSTQLIEAGVDIDVDIVYRDFGPLDSINQVSGRCNRNDRNETQGVVNIYRINDGRRDIYSYIYDGLPMDKTFDTLNAHTDGIEGAVVEEASFLKLINDYFSKIKRALSTDTSKELLQRITKLEFEHIYDEFKLIDEAGYEKLDLFVELDARAQELWQRYEHIQCLTDKRDRYRAFLQIKRDFYDYVISVPVRDVPDEIHESEYLGRIPNEMLEIYYDDTTGFKR